MRLAKNEGGRRKLGAEANPLDPLLYQARAGDPDKLVKLVEDRPPAVPLVEERIRPELGDVVPKTRGGVHLSRDDARASAEVCAKGVAEDVNALAGLDLSTQVGDKASALRLNSLEKDEGQVVVGVSRDDAALILFA